jgi:hypothetical protein
LLLPRALANGAPTEPAATNLGPADRAPA